MLQDNFEKLNETNELSDIEDDTLNNQEVQDNFDDIHKFIFIFSI